MFRVGWKTIIEVNMKNRTCTWEDCSNEAKNPLISSDNETWADLCDHHLEKFNTGLKSGVKETLAAWVKAQGGPKKASNRF